MKMAEYIKREAVLRAVQGQRSPCRSPAQNRMLDCLKAAVIRISAADVAPVVRCKGCKHLVAVNVNGKGIPTCRVSGMEVAPDEFCSRGEKGRR
nr:MAG TPA: hypothetical protein [Caudoviricetes sp.]